MDSAYCARCRRIRFGYRPGEKCDLCHDVLQSVRPSRRLPRNPKYNERTDPVMIAAAKLQQEKANDSSSD